MVRVAIALKMLLVLVPSAAWAQAPIIGTVRHIEDGDTFCVGSIKIRLDGIDAPEINDDCWRNKLRWKCGSDASSELSRQALGKTIICEPKYCDRYGRTVALCRVNGVDLSGAMVAAGWAIDWPHYSGGRYKVIEDGARSAGRGLWSNGGGMTWRMWRRTWWPLGTRPNKGPRPPCKTLCEGTHTSDR